MIYKLEAYMDGIPLTSLGRVTITDISHNAATLAVSTAPLANVHGDRVLDRRWSQAAVTITVVLGGDSPAERQELCQSVAAWAKGRILQTSDRYGQQLRCICTVPPQIQNTINRVERISMTFTAYQNPFWEDEYPLMVTLSGTNDSGSIYVPGNVPAQTVLEIEAAPMSGTLNDLAITAGEHTLSFEGLGATALSPLKIVYTDQMIQKITVGDTSALDKRTRSSADDLLAEIGGHTVIGITANVGANVRFLARGKWL